MLEAIVASHRAVVDAIADRDADRARRLAGEHIDRRTRWQIELHLQRALAESAGREVS
jgi:DNA-binding FadR family transcriptional regulator